MTEYIWHDDDYDKRLKLVIDNSKVDEDLENFPVLIHLSDSSGITSADVTSVFDELTTVSATNTTYNPDDKYTDIALSNGNLTVDHAGSGYRSVRSFAGVSSGKWYWEVTVDASTDQYFGVGNSSADLSQAIGKDNSDSWGLLGYYNPARLYYNAGSYDDYGPGWSISDVIGIALDMDNGKIWFSTNGVYPNSGNPATGANPGRSGLTGTLYAMISPYNSSCTSTTNFGATSFSYTTPSGFVAGLTHDAYINNDKKIAIYTVSGTQDVQCYTEIENWNVTSSGSDAWLWTKIPTIVSGTDTNLYLYYDKDHADNTSYIGDTGDLAAENVWDNNFVGVWHLAQDPNGDAANCILDSTSNANNGTPAGSMTSDDLVDGKVGKAIDFVTDDYINIIDSPSLDYSTSFTTEFLAQFDTVADNCWLVSKGGGWNRKGHFTHVLPTGNIRMCIGNGSTEQYVDNSGFTTNIWYQITMTYDRSGPSGKLYRNTVKLPNELTNNYDFVNNYPVRFAESDGNSPLNFDGWLDEIRFSKIDRSEAWISATYYSNWDNLITFGVEEPKPAFVFNGYVQVQGVPSARVVNLYHRSTGNLVGTATSNDSTGYFEITTPFNDYHFVNILPELSEDYNILVEDKIKYGS